MKNSGKRTLSLLLSILLLLTTLPGLTVAAGAAAVGGVCGTNVKWSLNNSGTLTISGSGRMQNFDSDIDWDVYWEEAPWSGYREEITNIVIQPGVTYVGENAFADCKYCTSVVIPEGVTEIGSWAFENCRSLKTITLPESVTEIDGYAFEDCKSLTNVTLPEHLTKIDEGTFMGCESLTNVELPESVTHISAFAFDGCRSLTSFVIPKGVPGIHTSTFKNCTSLTSVTIPDGVTNIYNCAFDGCRSLTNVTLPKSITGIYYSVFDNCKNLSSITFLGSSPSMVDTCFKSVTTTVFYPCNDETWTDTVKSDYGGTITWQRNHSFGDDVIISDATCTLDASHTGTCEDCGGFETITFPGTATGHSFGEYVTKQEAGCTQDTLQARTCETCGTIETVTIPNTATGHHYNATGQCVDCGVTFQLVVYMTDTYGDSWNGSAIAVYTNDTLLTEVSLPNEALTGKEEVPYIPAKTYTLKWKSSACDNECGFKITLNGEMLASGQGSSYSDGQVLCTFETACAHVYQTTVTPPTCTEEGYTTGTCTVCGYSGILTTTPATGHSYVDGVCTVCHEEEGIANGSCGEGLQWRLLEDGTLTITGTGPMYRYSMPENSSDPDTPWCQYRQSITKVVIQSGATTIGEYAFHGCTALTDITIPESVTDIGKLAFYNCPGLTVLTIPEGVTTIGSAAFRRCSGLTKVTLPESLTTIGKITFFDCTGLKEVTIPQGVTSIGEHAFANCTDLATITFSGTAPTMGNDCLRNVTATVIHPCNDKTWTDTVKQSYGGAITWKADHSFGDYVPDGNATCTADGTANRICSTCGTTETKAMPNTATGHTKTTISGQAPTCTEIGLTEGVQCSVCNEVLTAQQTIPATGHTEKTVPGKAPTCTETGLTDGVQCSVCNEVLTAQQTIPVIDHEYLVTQVPVTCTGYGYDLHQCQNCGNSVYHNVTDPTGHRYENGVCTVCGDGSIAILPGDVNGDGERNIIDVSAHYAYVKGTPPLDSGFLPYADVNGDGNVDIADTARLYAHVKGTKPLN